MQAFALARKRICDAHDDVFTHLHVHSEYSLLDGASRVAELPRRAKELGQTSLALTDHGVMFGAVNFYNACKDAGIKPVIGCEVYVAPRGRADRNLPLDRENAHLVLLVKNEEGYKNLIYMVSVAFTEGFYYKPRVDMELLRTHGGGLIALSACLAGNIPRLLLDGDYEGAKKKVAEFKEIFDEFYIELQDHGIEDQKRVNPLLIKLAKETDTPLVVTNDSHYINKEDALVQDVLMCIQTGKTLDEENRMRFETEEFYLKSEDEMRALFPDLPEAFDNTAKIAEKCNFDFDFKTRHLPKFPLPDGEGDSFEYLKKLCEAGLSERYATVTDEARERLSYELGVIKNMGFTDYFLVVWDYVKFAKDHDIFVGPGRGSAAGSIVAYTLHITDIDPLEYGLLFERFLNPERVSMPDIDMDFCDKQRDEVIRYVTKKYGEDHVSQIVTFGTMKARGAIRDTGRVLGLPLGFVDSIAKMVPQQLGITLRDAIKTPDLKAAYESNPDAKRLIDLAMKIEGLPKSSGTHAAGVVICEAPVRDFVPLQTNDETVTTQFTMETIERLGLLKMDFLGLKNLSIIRECLMNIRTEGKEIDFEHIRYDCKEVYEMISRGETAGVFQLESDGMTGFMQRLRPSCLEDIIAGIALYRPGPMDFIPQYIENKSHPDKIKYKHPLLEPILSMTYGCIVYQEQVMQIVQHLAGFSMGKADMVRKAMSKKKADVMAATRESFINGEKDADGNTVAPGCEAMGVDKKTAASIFDDMDAFAQYAFNKAHATSYAVVCYQTAYLKCFYPAEYMAALISNSMGDAVKTAQYTEECRRMGISILPPDINESRADFTVSHGAIRFGLGCIKNVGIGNIDACVREREENGDFKTLTDFVNRMHGEINKRAIEGLIKCGAFDNLPGSRAQKMAYFEIALDNAAAESKTNIAGQLSLFEEDETCEDNFPDVPEFSKKELFAMEKEATGMYLSGHPLDEARGDIEAMSDVTCASLSDAEESGIADKSFVTICGIVTAVRPKLTKSNSLMAYVTLEDLTGSVELIVFPKIWQNANSFLREDEIVTVSGRVDVQDERGAKIIVDTAAPFTPSAGKTLVIDASGKEHLLDEVRRIVLSHKGSMPIRIGNIPVVRSIRADGSDMLIAEINSVFGEPRAKIV